jgi:hypothetical protein
MNEQDVRALVREAIERHMAHRRDTNDAQLTPSPSPLVRNPLPGTLHPSHTLLSVVPGSDGDDGMCVIEPRVRCSHCGFCQSFGH